LKGLRVDSKPGGEVVEERGRAVGEMREVNSADEEKERGGVQVEARRRLLHCSGCCLKEFGEGERKAKKRKRGREGKERGK
jgi:hypothetical protein